MWIKAIVNDEPTQFKSYKDKFKALLEAWEASTAGQSVKLNYDGHYQQIIGMGERAVPYLIDELKTNPSHLFAALRSITGQSVIPEAFKGVFSEMTKAWLEWADQTPNKQKIKLIRLNNGDPDFKKIPDYGDAFSLKEFDEAVENGTFCDYDGTGHYASNTEMDRSTDVKPSLFNPKDAPDWATQVIWFNK